MSTTYSPAPVFIPTTTTTTTTTVTPPPVEVVPTTTLLPNRGGEEGVNEIADVVHNQTTVTELPVTVSPSTRTNDSLWNPVVTTIVNRISMEGNEEEVTTKKTLEIFETVKPVLGEGEVMKGDPIEKGGEVNPVKVEDGIASGVIEVITTTTTTEASLAVEDNFPTTKLWISDTSLSAEHKDSIDQNILPEATTLTPLPPTTILNDEYLLKGSGNNSSKTSVEVGSESISSSSPFSSSSPSTPLEPVEEVSLTTSSDNLTIM